MFFFSFFLKNIYSLYGAGGKGLNSLLKSKNLQLQFQKSSDAL